MSAVVQQDSLAVDMTTEGGERYLAAIPAFIYAISYSMSAESFSDDDQKPSGIHGVITFNFLSDRGTSNDSRRTMVLAIDQYCSGPGQYVGPGGGQVTELSGNVVFPVPLDVRHFFANSWMAWNGGTPIPETQAHFVAGLQNRLVGTLYVTVTYATS